MPERDLAAELAALTAQPEPEPLLVHEDPTAGVRQYPTPGDNDVARAVLAARAVVKLDEDGWTLRRKVALLERQVAVLRTEARNASDSARRERDLRVKVQFMHYEAQEVTCGDGCCTEGLGWCAECGEETPWPCRTYKVADGSGDE